jgi:prolyl 4-hydroxylase
VADAAGPAQDVKALADRAEAGDPAAQLKFSQLFRQAGHAEQAQEWLERALAQNFAPARTERGQLSLARMALSEALADFETGAAAGDAAAQFALSGLAVTGVAPGAGGWTQGVAWLIAAARQGHKTALRELGFLAAMADETAASNDLLSLAAQKGDGIAAFTVITRAHERKLTLAPQRDAAYRAALARLRFPLTPPGQAADPRTAFPPPDAAPEIDWQALAKVLREPPGLHFGTPQSLSSAPDIWLCKRVLSGEECDYVIVAGAHALAPARVIDPESGQGRQDALRTNLAAATPPAWMTPGYAALALRVAALSGMSLAHGEPAGLLCYRPGEEYRPHFDWLGPGAMYDAGGQRVRTALVYLNQDYEGGQTRFMTPGLNIPAAKGDAALFNNAHPDATPDMTTRHAGMPVTRGVKFLWSQWYRERPVMALTQ